MVVSFCKCSEVQSETAPSYRLPCGPSSVEPRALSDAIESGSTFISTKASKSQFHDFIGKAVGRK